MTDESTAIAPGNDASGEAALFQSIMGFSGDDASAPPDQDADNNDGNAEPSGENPDAIGEDEENSSETEAVEPATETSDAIEPPASWSSEDKEVFKALPPSMQETIARRERERDVFFDQRSRELAQRARQTADLEAQAEQARAYHAQALDSLMETASQLMPAKFSEIRSEADYLRMKQEDPARASEYEAFQIMLHRANEERTALATKQQTESLNREWARLQERFPEFKDPAKATEIWTGIQKVAVEAYGFTPDEVAIIPDHRYVPILRDALAWRNHQQTLRLVEAKKTSPITAPKVVKAATPDTGGSKPNVRANILQKALQETNPRRQAELLASIN